MIPQEICLDANVFISAFIPLEANHENSSKLIELVKTKQIILFEPAIVISEVVSAIHRKIMQDELVSDKGEPLIDLFFQLPLLLQWQAGLMKKSARLASDLSLKRIYDCTYLAVAMAREIPFVTLDDEFIKKGRSLYRQIHTVKSFVKDFI